jgi:hypothetical protein
MFASIRTAPHVATRHHTFDRARSWAFEVGIRIAILLVLLRTALRVVEFEVRGGLHQQKRILINLNSNNA